MVLRTSFVSSSLIIFLLLTAFAVGQEAAPAAQERESKITTIQRIRDLPAEWLIGPYIPSGLPLEPLSNAQRREVYVNQTFLSVQAYVTRAFVAGIDQARGTPPQWGGGASAYGQRFGSRYGSFVIASTLHSLGDAALGYESRYDFCRCHGLERRSLHAIARNFVNYNRTEKQLRPAIPLYAGSFAAGMISSTWLPGHRNVWKDGAYGALVQAGYGSAVNWVREFSLDILRKLTGNRYPPEIGGNRSLR